MDILEPKIKSKDYNPRTQIDEEYLYREYVINNKPITKIAKEINHDYRTVTRRLRKMNVKIKDNGDYNTIDLTGQQFGWLTVVKRDGSDDSGRAYWKCICNRCNNEVSVSGKVLRQGHAKSCGCPKRFSFEETICHYLKNYKNQAKNRGIFFNISLEYICSLLIKQEFKCAISGVDIRLPTKLYKKSEGTISLDRIDSSKGYIEGNVQWVHKDLNYMKMDLPEAEFFNWIDIIYKYRNGVKINKN